MSGATGEQNPVIGPKKPKPHLQRASRPFHDVQSICWWADFWVTLYAQSQVMTSYKQIQVLTHSEKC